MDYFYRINKDNATCAIKRPIDAAEAARDGYAPLPAGVDPNLPVFVGADKQPTNTIPAARVAAQENRRTDQQILAMERTSLRALREYILGTPEQRNAAHDRLALVEADIAALRAAKKPA